MSRTPDAIAVILALGSGNPIAPLTADRALPAVPFGGNFRVIDFVLTNCLHSGLRQILVLTHYNSHSLLRHLRDGWAIFNAELGEYITPVPPQMRDGNDGYGGPLDAIGQNLHLIERSGAETVLVAAGDEIYRMDYAALLRYHKKSRADATLACLPVPGNAGGGGRMRVQVADDHRVEALAPVAGDGEAPGSHAMGVLAVDRRVLVSRLEAGGIPGDGPLEETLVPALLGRYRVMAYRFGGTAGRVRPDRYWCRPHSVDAYYRANMDLLQLDPPLDLYQRDWAVRTYQSQVPPARTVPGKSNNEGVCVNSIVAGGGIIAGGGVNHSILFPGVHVDDAAIVEDSILLAGVSVGENAHLRQCIVDKDVRIPPGTTIGLDPEDDVRRFSVSPGGIAVVPKGHRF